MKASEAGNPVGELFDKLPRLMDPENLRQVECDNCGENLHLTYYNSGRWVRQVGIVDCNCGTSYSLVDYYWIQRQD